MKYFLNKAKVPSTRAGKSVPVVLLLLSLVLLNGCKRGAGENEFLALTTIDIEDPIRHYYPILQGQKQNITMKITNTGTEPLKIYNVLPSCGCTLAKFPKNAIAPGNFGLLEMEYNSIKNIGHVGIHTTIVANTKKHYHTVYFDLNVVPDALYTKDYEELYHIQMEEEKSGLQELVEGETNERGYIVDSTEVRKFM